MRLFLGTVALLMADVRADSRGGVYPNSAGDQISRRSLRNLQEIAKTCPPQNASDALTCECADWSNESQTGSFTCTAPRACVVDRFLTLLCGELTDSQTVNEDGTGFHEGCLVGNPDKSLLFPVSRVCSGSNISATGKIFGCTAEVDDQVCDCEYFPQTCSRDSIEPGFRIATCPDQNPIDSCQDGYYISRLFELDYLRIPCPPVDSPPTEMCQCEGWNPELKIGSSSCEDSNSCFCQYDAESNCVTEFCGTKETTREATFSIDFIGACTMMDPVLYPSLVASTVCITDVETLRAGEVTTSCGASVDNVLCDCQYQPDVVCENLNRNSTTNREGSFLFTCPDHDPVSECDANWYYELFQTDVREEMPTIAQTMDPTTTPRMSPTNAPFSISPPHTTTTPTQAPLTLAPTPSPTNVPVEDSMPMTKAPSPMASPDTPSPFPSTAPAPSGAFSSGAFSSVLSTAAMLSVLLNCRHAGYE